LSPVPMTRPPLVLPALVVAITAISAAAVLVRLAPSVPAPAAAFWRCALVALLLLPTLRRVRGRDVALTAFAGLALALHFWTWFESLRHTSVLRSTVLVCLSPVWTALLEWAVLRARPAGRYWLGLGVALLGVGVMVAAGARAGVAPGLLGDGLAVVGGVLAGVYMVIGRAVRQRVGIGSYGTLVSGTAAMWLLVVILVVPVATQRPIALHGWSGVEWAALVGLAAGPQLLGHIGLNYAVRYLPAAVVALVVLLEPAGATLLVGVVLGEWPSLLECVGAAVILLGVAMASTSSTGAGSTHAPFR